MASQPEVTEYNTSPLAQDVIGKCLRENPLAFPPPSGRWDVGRMELFNEERWKPVFRKMRAEAPINKVTGTIHGDYWNIANHKAIVHVEALPDIFSSSHTHGGVTLYDPPKGADPANVLKSFITMDRPEHTDRRRVIAQAFTPSQMTRFTGEVRERTRHLLNALPEDEEFDWVSKVSVSLTTAMLAVLFDFPREDSELLSYWSDWVGAVEAAQLPEVAAGRAQAKREMAHYFHDLWGRRGKASDGDDLLSLMIQSDALGEMDDAEFMSTMVTLVTGGNDTTRNTMSGLVHALHDFPEQRELLEKDHSLAAKAVPEVIRYVSPIVHMRRTATQDTDLFGHSIKAGDKLAMWYLSGNHDETVFEDPDRFDVMRHNARRHVAFGYGIHRCVGARLAELQLLILLEEMLGSRIRVHVTGQPVRCGGASLHGYKELPVKIERY